MAILGASCADSDDGEGIPGLVPEEDLSAIDQVGARPDISDEDIEPDIKPEGSAALSDHIDIPSFSGILSQFDSYEYELKVRFIGHTMDGQPSDWNLTNRYILIEGSAGYYSDLQYQGDGSFLDLDRVIAIELDGISYLHLPDVGCIVNSLDTRANPYEGAPFLDQVIGPILAASITDERTEINDIEVRRYVFDVESLPEWQPEDTSVSGEIYLAEDGIPVRVILAAEGQRDFLDQDSMQVGEFAMSLDLSNFNDRTVVELPASCTAQPDYPILADAFDITLLEELVTYKSRVSLDQAVEFYQDEMAAAGWASDNSAVIEGSALLSFSSGDRQVTINVDQDRENEPIVIVISP